MLELRQVCKRLQVENYNMEQMITKLKEIDENEQITDDIKEMVYGDLKNKLLKLAQAYNTEKMRNKEFESTMDRANNQLKELSKTSG